MTTSSSPLPDLQRDTIIQAALWTAGYLETSQSPSPADVSMATTLFRLLLGRLQGEGVVLRTTERALLTLANGVAEYTLDADTIDVEVDQNGVVGMIVPSTGTGETPVMEMRGNEWLQIANKSVGPSRPTRAYVEKQAAVTVVFYPPPGTESAQFRYRRVRLLKDVDTGTVTPDLPSRWSYALTAGLAALVARAKSLPETRVQSLLADYNQAKLEVRREDVERGPTRLRLRHSGRNWR